MEDTKLLTQIFSKNLIQQLARRDMAQNELAKQLGVSATAVNNWCKGHSMPRMDKIDKICAILRIQRSDLLQTKKSPNTAFESFRLPVIGSIAGGVPIEAVADFSTEDWEEIPAGWMTGDHEYIALRVKGDSMAPRITDGDVVIILKQPDCNNGDICAVYVNGYEATLKKILKQSNGGIVLQPLNPAYEAKAYSKKECEELPVVILGRVIELRGKF